MTLKQITIDEFISCLSWETPKSSGEIARELGRPKMASFLLGIVSRLKNEGVIVDRGANGKSKWLQVAERPEPEPTPVKTKVGRFDIQKVGRGADAITMRQMPKLRSEENG